MDASYVASARRLRGSSRRSVVSASSYSVHSQAEQGSLQDESVVKNLESDLFEASATKTHGLDSVLQPETEQPGQNGTVKTQVVTSKRGRRWPARLLSMVCSLVVVSILSVLFAILYMVVQGWGSIVDYLFSCTPCGLVLELPTPVTQSPITASCRQFHVSVEFADRVTLRCLKTPDGKYSPLCPCTKWSPGLNLPFWPRDEIDFICGAWLGPSFPLFLPSLGYPSPPWPPMPLPAFPSTLFPGFCWD
ncbi:ADP-ribosylation factor-like protein 6-interacting protein 6 isoform X1 [Bufo gargarizans]|uniref:ADP-ribosylation factor-like protein 6-interacting protein 6 isoform X1 n=1 Tax=Bufo gargarizans TaxID=30331 RepID=UPI001CF45FF1|nr:ADP-ribosylation factor-like protein 6-interacting protein 6 isoform X1 [Bufo gargarizans]